MANNANKMLSGRIAHLCFAKSQHFRSAAFDYLALYESLIFALQRVNTFAPRLLTISLFMNRSIGFGHAVDIH
ncbi:hypothetical protein LEP1GSC040_0399 [Leptospira santarosai str. 2000030832]|nr:hypothetical protein LEP1GSC040_0399 [Leptospira santarosai str. 2000030832]